MRKFLRLNVHVTYTLTNNKPYYSMLAIILDLEENMVVSL